MFARTIMASMSCMLVIPFLIQAVYATTDENGKAIRHRDLTIDLGNGVQFLVLRAESFEIKQHSYQYPLTAHLTGSHEAP